MEGVHCYSSSPSCRKSSVDKNFSLKWMEMTCKDLWYPSYRDDVHHPVTSVAVGNAGLLHGLWVCVLGCAIHGSSPLEGLSCKLPRNNVCKCFGWKVLIVRPGKQIFIVLMLWLVVVSWAFAWKYFLLISYKHSSNGEPNWQVNPALTPTELNWL